MSPKLFYILMDGCMREMKAKMGNVGKTKKLWIGSWWHACLQMTPCCLQREKRIFRKYWMNFIVYVRTRRKLKVNVRKSKVMIFERREIDG